MSFLQPPDTPDVAYEFFAPFAHVPGKYEGCRIRSATHGVLDTFIWLGPPVTVYVNSAAGQRYLAERYPEVAAHRVPAGDLRLREAEGGRVVQGSLRAGKGPLREVRLRVAALPGAKPVSKAYGGQGAPVWGSRRFTCWGVDLDLEARATGVLRWADGRTERLRGEPALLTLGSFGRIAPLQDKV
jgi:hypothetical protein